MLFVNVKIRLSRKILTMFVCNYSQATAVNFDSVIPEISHYKQKEVTPRAWNIPLSFGNVFSIKVIGYKKVFTN